MISYSDMNERARCFVLFIRTILTSNVWRKERETERAYVYGRDHNKWTQSGVVPSLSLRP